MSPHESRRGASPLTPGHTRPHDRGLNPVRRAGGDLTDRPMPTPMLSDSSSYVTLSAMMTPALLMTASGSLIISTSNRMSRIVDRIRVLNDLADRLDRGESGLDYPDLRRDHADEELRHLVYRSDQVRTALSELYLALSAFVGTSLTLVS